jgi:hypothetical protein
VRLLDISETGARLQVRSALKKGDEIELAFLPTGQPRPLKILARVAWCESTPEGDYAIGARFERPLLYKDIIGLAIPMLRVTSSPRNPCT